MNESRRYWLIAAVALVALAAGAYLWNSGPPPAAQSPEPVESSKEAAAPRHPLAPLSADPGLPLPPLADSDPALAEAVQGLKPEARWQDVFEFDGIVRRWVISVDAVPRQRFTQRTSPVRRVAGELATEGEAETLVLSSANFARYDACVSLAEAIDPKALVDVYRRFYPLFQEAYADLIRRDGYFNDRVIEVIDHLLTAPEAPSEIRLVRPKVMFEFADPALEARSVGEKALMRMGPDNARRAKAVLSRVRAEIVAASVEPASAAPAE